MAITLWNDVERGLTNTEFDNNFIELAAGCLPQSNIDSLPTVKSSLVLDFTRGIIHPSIAFSGSDASIVVSSFNTTSGTFYINCNIASGQPIIGSSTTSYYNSVGSGKYALVYSGTSLTVYYNGVSQGTTTITGIDSTVKLYSVDSSSISTKYSFVKWYPVSLSSTNAIRLTS